MYSKFSTNANENWENFLYFSFFVIGKDAKL